MLPWTFFSLSERDAFDTLFDHAPDKLNVVKKVGKGHLGGKEGGQGGRSEMQQNFLGKPIPAACKHSETGFITRSLQT